MTHYGTLRAWAFIATLVGIFGMIAAAIGADRVGVRGRRLLADGRRPAHRAARRDLHRDAPDRARAGAPGDRRRRRHGGRSLAVSEQVSSGTDGGKRALPLILAVDEDAEALELITGELQRYARDYRVVCGPSSEAALEQLESLRERDAAVAIVLAARGTQELKGEELLARVHDLHPHAKRALLIPWGGWADEETADAIRDAMALGHIDYYALKPFSTPDELFHRLVSEFLQEWRRQNAPGRRELTVVADPWSPRGYELRNLLARNGVPHAFHTPDSDEGLEFLRSCSRKARTFPSSSSRTALRSSTRGRRTSRSTGRACGRSSTIPARSTSSSSEPGRRASRPRCTRRPRG